MGRDSQQLLFCLHANGRRRERRTPAFVQRSTWRWRHSESSMLRCSLPPTGGGAEAQSPALEQRSTDLLQLPLPSRVAG